jgi:tRNA(fMet)-specific endonuclease VapC
VTLLDTNVCIAFLNGSDEAVRSRVRDATDDLVLCSVVKAELLYGARRSAQVDHNLERLQQFFALLPSLAFDDGAAEHYGVVRALLASAGTPIGSNDLLIASIALGNGAAVATRNTGEFHRVPGLRVEAW